MTSPISDAPMFNLGKKVLAICGVTKARNEGVTEIGRRVMALVSDLKAKEEAADQSPADEVERVRQQIKSNELAMIEERKAQYGSKFKPEQQVAIEMSHRQQLIGANLMAAALSAIRNGDEGMRLRKAWHSFTVAKQAGSDDFDALKAALEANR